MYALRFTCHNVACGRALSMNCEIIIYKIILVHLSASSVKGALPIFCRALMIIFCCARLSSCCEGRDTKNSQPANKKILRIRVVVSSGEGADEVLAEGEPGEG